MCALPVKTSPSVRSHEYIAKAIDNVATHSSDLNAGKKDFIEHTTADMESLVLCPEELCLGPVSVDSPSAIGISPPPADLTIWSSEAVDKGTRFLPWKGTVRSDSLPVFDKLPEFDVSSCNLTEIRLLDFFTRYFLPYNRFDTGTDSMTRYPRSVRPGRSASATGSASCATASSTATP